MRFAGRDTSVANGVRLLDQPFHLVGESDMIPRTVTHHIIGRNAVAIKGDRGDSGFIIVDLSCDVHTAIGEQLHEFMAELVIPNGGDRRCFHTVLRGMIDEVGRRPARLLARGEHVPQQLAHSEHGFGIPVGDFRIHGCSLYEKVF